MAAENLDHLKNSPDNDRDCSRLWLEIALIFVVFFIVGGALAPQVNETYYLTKAKHYWQPDWCAGDMFLESADAHTVFYWSVGWLSKFFSLTTVAWIGRVVAWLLLAWSWQGLSRRVFPGPWRAVLSAMMFVTLIDHTNFAGEWVIGGVEGKCFAYAFVFWGLTALADGRWQAVWPRLGLASAFHVLVGGWSVLAAGIVWLTRPRSERLTLKRMLPFLLLGGVCSLPGLIPALQLTAGVDTATAAEASRIYVFDRIPHHLAPLQLPMGELLGKSIRYEVLMLVFLLLWLACRRDLQATPQAKKLDRLMAFAAGSLVIAAIGLLWHVVNWGRPLSAAPLLKYYLFRLSDIAVPIAVCLELGWLINLLVERRSKWASLLLLVAIAIPSWHLFAMSCDRTINPRPPADRGIRDVTAWQDTCTWARKNTSQESLFLTPRRAQSFNWNAHRPDLVNWKEVPQDAEALLNWHQRYFDVFFHTDEAGERVAFQSLAMQGTQRIQELAKKYEIDYVLTDEYPPLDLPVVYSNASYTIYAIE